MPCEGRGCDYRGVCFVKGEVVSVVVCVGRGRDCRGVCLVKGEVVTSLVPRLLVGRVKREPGIHCFRMCLISQKSWEIGNYRVISVKL